MKANVLFFCLMSTIHVVGQKQGQDRADSLISQLSLVKEDRTKLDLYVTLMSTYNVFDKDEALRYEKPAMDLARKLNTKTGEADVKNEVGRVYWRKGLFDLALKQHQEAKQIFQDAQDEDKIAVTIRYLGQDYADAGHYPEALRQFRLALDMYTQLGDRINMAYVHDLFAWVYHKQGNFVEALKSSYACLALFEDIGDQNNIALAASDVAEHYLHSSNFSEALKYSQRSQEIYEAQGDRLNLAYNHIVMGKTYCAMGSYREALMNHQAALSIGTEVTDRNIMANAHMGMADAYLAINAQDGALAHLLASAHLFGKAPNRVDLAHVYCKIGERYRIQKENFLARKYYDSAFTLATELDSRTLVADYHQGMARLDSAMGRWKNAYAHHHRYLSLRDSIFNQDNIRKMLQLQLAYEFDKKEAALNVERREKEVRQQRQVFFLSIIMGLIFLLALVLFQNQHRIKQINRQLHQKSESLEDEIRAKTGILNIVSHDLKAPFSKIKGLTDLMLVTEDKTEKEQFIAHIQTSIEQGNYLINKLFEAEMVYSEANPPARESIDIGKFLRDFEMSSQGQLFKKQQRLQTDIQLPTAHAWIDSQMLTRILDNLVSNASKFSGNGKLIYLRAWREGSHLCLSVRDEGPGISDADQKKMFRKFQKLTARPTAGEGSTGLGLSIVSAIVEKLKGTIAVKSKVGEGTEIIVSLPYWGVSS